MATINIRKNKNGTTPYRVQIRRKGLPIFMINFRDFDKAVKWVKEHEAKYIENPEAYQGTPRQCLHATVGIANDNRLEH